MPKFFPSQLLFGLLFVSFAAHAQSSPTPVPMPNAVPPGQQSKPQFEGRPLYKYVAKMPVYLDGGQEGLQAFISSHVRGAASGSGAYVTFIIAQTGKARRPALGPKPAESEAAIDPALATAFSSIGTFNPGYQNRKPTDVELTMRIAGPLKE